jgi:hypothetical protein
VSLRFVSLPLLQGEAKQEEESRWLQERRELRATDRRKNEQERILRVQEEMYVQH